MSGGARRRSWGVGEVADLALQPHHGHGRDAVDHRGLAVADVDHEGGQGVGHVGGLDVRGEHVVVVERVVEVPGHDEANFLAVAELDRPQFPEAVAHAAEGLPDFGPGRSLRRCRPPPRPRSARPPTQGRPRGSGAAGEERRSSAWPAIESVARRYAPSAWPAGWRIAARHHVLPRLEVLPRQAVGLGNRRRHRGDLLDCDLLAEDVQPRHRDDRTGQLVSAYRYPCRARYAWTYTAMMGDII